MDRGAGVKQARYEMRRVCIKEEGGCRAWDILGVFKYWGLSKTGPWGSTVYITWELVRNADSQVPARTSCQQDVQVIHGPIKA